MLNMFLLQKISQIGTSQVDMPIGLQVGATLFAMAVPIYVGWKKEKPHLSVSRITCPADAKLIEQIEGVNGKKGSNNRMKKATKRVVNQNKMQKNSAILLFPDRKANHVLTLLINSADTRRLPCIRERDYIAQMECRLQSGWCDAIGIGDIGIRYKGKRAETYIKPVNSSRVPLVLKSGEDVTILVSELFDNPRNSLFLTAKEMGRSVTLKEQCNFEYVRIVFLLYRKKKIIRQTFYIRATDNGLQVDPE